MQNASDQSTLAVKFETLTLLNYYSNFCVYLYIIIFHVKYDYIEINKNIVFSQIGTCSSIQ